MITSSQIIEDSLQADGRRWVTEQHISAIGNKYSVTYLCEAGVNAETVMDARVPQINQQLKDTEIAVYLNDIENGVNVIGETYNETSQAVRALHFLYWAKDNIQANTLEPLRYAWKVTEPYTIAQINGLLSGTQFENKADKIKLWEAKLKSMDLEMTAASEAAGEV